ncbi:uncharacterized protein EAE97_010262 [Botrytis byssoidea]|uniref:Uncharacterized protein n=1 Tax=Botrytis byssoidea TaxID=139641 RepID=A0A9P5HY67_9HELO|nr:uncharacterized protein EAE97_010262 [Botrytis byssoidea]KAF7926753.1 hypothetical protein EAE97_010262 [Botrytis byssoidea]
MHISHPELFRYHQSPTHSPKVYHAGQVPTGAVLHIAPTSAFDSAVFTLYQMLHTFLWRNTRSEGFSSCSKFELQVKDATPGAYSIASQMSRIPSIDRCPVILSKVWEMSVLSTFKYCISVEILQPPGLRTESLTAVP